MFQNNVLVIAGKKQSGKSSLINFLYGHTLKQRGIIDKFSIYQTGELEVPSTLMDEHGNITETLGILDVDRDDVRYMEYASVRIWPYIKHYNLATPLKSIAMSKYKIDKELLYGTNADKNKPTQYKWMEFSSVVPKKELDQLKKEGKLDQYMTGREFAQKMGDVMRSIYVDCFVDPCIDAISMEGSELSLVGDCRFVNEFYKFKKEGAKVIKLLKSVDEDQHKSETELDLIDNDEFDFVLDNREMSINQKNVAMMNKMKEWGWYA